MAPLRRFARITFTASLGLGISTIAFAGWLPSVSEENGGPPSLCPGTFQAVNGFDATGSWTDNLQLHCAGLPLGIHVVGYNNSEFFSEEGADQQVAWGSGWYAYDDGASHVCNPTGAGGVVTGIRCRGDYCDEISVECAIPVVEVDGSPWPAELHDCAWQGPFSEEDHAFTLPAGAFITGVRCEGSYCDNMSMHVCQMRVPVDSCLGVCDGTAFGSCYCDDLCESFGDCCSDHLTCGSPPILF